MATHGLAAPERGPREPQRATRPLRVRLTHLDGELPNLALMKLAAYHRAQGDEIIFTRNPQRGLFEEDYDRVYGSAIFTRSAPLVKRLQTDFPNAVVGGTGTDSVRTVEEELGLDAFPFLDCSIDPTRPLGGGRRVPEDRSIGRTMSGCRMRCTFCVVPRIEGRAKATGTIAEIYRGDPYPKTIILLDNDFFGVADSLWQARIAEIRAGDYNVSFNQGINVRLVSEDQATAIASVRYYNNRFTTRTLYTAFDSAKDERVFRRGVERLLAAGVRGEHIMSYMLVGFAPDETWADIFRRLAVMREYGIRPFPMPYQPFTGSQPANGIAFRQLKAFQRYVVRRHYHRMSWEDYLHAPEGRRRNLHNATRNFLDEIT